MAVVREENGECLYVAKNGIVYRSEDRGKTFEKVEGMEDLHFHFNLKQKGGDEN